MKNSEKVVKLLKRIDRLLSDESKWTKGTYARNAEGDVVMTGSAEATCFCLTGALIKCGDKSPDSVFNTAYLLLFKSLTDKHGFPSDFNDHADTTFAEIKAGIAKAIQAAEAAKK